MTTFHTGSTVPTAPWSRRSAQAVLALAMVALMLAGSLAFAARPAGALEEGPTPGGGRADWTSDAQRGNTAYEIAEATSELSLRDGPSPQDDILAVIPAGTSVEITGAAENGYVPVTFRGLEGFANGEHLAVRADADDGEPVASAGNGVDGSDGYTTDEIVQIIYNAAAMYGQSGDDMLRVARCESVLDPWAVNGSSGASGLFQFMPGTWATTPYAGHDIFDPVANAEAAGWMWANGRRGEWSCQ